MEVWHISKWDRSDGSQIKILIPETTQHFHDELKYQMLHTPNTYRNAE